MEGRFVWRELGFGLMIFLWDLIYEFILVEVFIKEVVNFVVCLW